MGHITDSAAAGRRSRTANNDKENPDMTTNNANEDMTIKNVTVLGTGVLGSQIAYQTGYSGLGVGHCRRLSADHSELPGQLRTDPGSPATAGC
jgi:hypothetical protein